jgi:DNA-binding protein HU-beta
MTKAELIERIHKDAGGRLSKRQVAGLVEVVIDNLAAAIRKHKRFSMPGFGTFRVRAVKGGKRKLPPRPGQSEPMEKEFGPSKTVRFRPAPEFKKSL